MFDNLTPREREIADRWGQPLLTDSMTEKVDQRNVQELLQTISDLRGKLGRAQAMEKRIIQHVRFHRELASECFTYGIGDYSRGRAYGIECLADDINQAIKEAQEGKK